MKTSPGLVMVATALLSAPILWETLLTGAWPTDAALLRCLAIAAACWMGLSALGALLRATDGPRAADGSAVDGPETGRPAGVASTEMTSGETAPGDVPGSPAGRVTAVDSPAGR